MKQNVILIGMPASGKSTLGQLVARELDLDFLDTDHILRDMTGRPLQQILQEDGLERFLQLEEAALCSVRVEHSIIATGGSAVYSDTGMRHLKSLGLCVYISTPYAAIAERLHNLSTRGVAIAEGKTLRELYRERTPLYAAYADLTFREPRGRDRDIQDNARSLANLLRTRGFG